ncbi:piggyBac transposable element-derived protein 4-like [Vespula squamosa]|uniref:PiggyBac transposable element-derived protein 4-like n=1 Tax=Vespula squamosa TaxID=30214 RepID=A0ABD2BG86_VESSQ
MPYYRNDSNEQERIAQCNKKANICKKKFMISYRRNNTLLLAWKDKRLVTCLITRGDTGMKTVRRITRGSAEMMIKKPNIILNYIKYMGGVDRADQYASTYYFLRKLKRGESPPSHLHFLKTFVEQLRGRYRQNREQASTSDEPRLNGKLHIVLKGAKRDSKVCFNRNKSGDRRETSYYCDTCPDKPRMHTEDCFTKYHTKNNYKV